MSLPTLIELAESGAHYGHHRSNVYPKAKKFVFDVRHNVALIDLEQTLDRLATAQKVLGDFQSQGKTVLFVGTKKGVRSIVKAVADTLSAPYVIERWLGGFLTNFETIHNNIKKMNELDEYLESDASKNLSKIDRLRQTSKLNRYHRFLGGVTKLKQVPDLLILASASEDKIALKEATQLNIPVIAICDTNIDPLKVTYPIPANDDAYKAVEIILNALISSPVKKAAKSTDPEKITEIKEEKPAKAVKKATKAVAEKKTGAKRAAVKKTAVKIEKKDSPKKVTKIVAAKKEAKKTVKKAATKEKK